MLISVDHGNKQVKTTHALCTPFTSGLRESATPPFGGEVLQYGGKYYTLVDERIPYRRDKTEDERFFVLTLFAIAKEIEARGAYTAGTIPVQLAVGLPPAHYGAQYQRFEQYFMNRGEVRFAFNQKAFSIEITNALCFPQAYAAAVTMFQSLGSAPKVLVVDIGGGSILLRRFIEQSGKVGQALFVGDIKANAKGYEVLYQISTARR